MCRNVFALDTWTVQQQDLISILIALRCITHYITFDWWVDEDCGRANWLPIILDAHVPLFNNYKAAGVYHQWCGKNAVRLLRKHLHLDRAVSALVDRTAFDKPISAWVAGKTNETTGHFAERIVRQRGFGGWQKDFRRVWADPQALRARSHGGRAFRTWPTRSRSGMESGNWSMLGLKSYQQGAGHLKARRNT